MDDISEHDELARGELEREVLSESPTPGGVKTSRTSKRGIRRLVDPSRRTYYSGVWEIVGVVALVTWVPMVSLRHCELSSCVGGLAKLLQTTPHLKSHERRQTWWNFFSLRQER